ncbi:glycosyltransferase family 4 protein [Nesterenkonia salmonea]|uniref:D-inositol 3-phosphate glycosyltransferase n=1 Tax=Nesterenkonia salmonea TaxID=1804987 RepID=A0A5R9BAP6_9MICC|nr:glycosyltransferase family 4 protein [Nesterenkonia salmonea]TLP97054.1 glycosyltransferase family 4 protein [Nesterenkonia salmonea]
MRIALIASSFLPRKGGVEEHVANTALQLRALGHEVVVWAADQGDEVPRDFQGIPLRYLPTPLPARAAGPAVRFLASAPRAWTQWLRAWRRDAPDILHLHCFGPNGLYATALSRLTRTPLVLSNHGETFSDAHGAFDQSGLLRRGLRAGLTRAEVVTSCSQFAAADLERFGIDPGEVQVVFNGINLHEAADGSIPELPERYVLGVGRLVGTKGFSNLIRAFAAIADHPTAAGVHLVIGGEGPEADQLAKLAAETGINDRIHLVGRLDRPQVGTVMANAEILVVPSLVEAFGITILEGWRAGVPVVVTRHGGPPEFVEDGVSGILIDPEDVVTMGEHISGLLADQQRRGVIGAAGAEAVKDFTWENVAQRYQEMYDAVGPT